MMTLAEKFARQRGRILRPDSYESDAIGSSSDAGQTIIEMFKCASSSLVVCEDFFMNKFPDASHLAHLSRKFLQQEGVSLRIVFRDQDISAIGNSVQWQQLAEQYSENLSSYIAPDDLLSHDYPSYTIMDGHAYRFQGNRTCFLVSSDPDNRANLLQNFDEIVDRSIAL